MKKLLSSVLALLSLSLCALTAYADIIVDPVPAPEPKGSALPTVLITAAVVIAAAVILYFLLRKRKK